MNNIKEKESLLWHRDKLLELTSFCLKKYAKTKNKLYFEKAKWFGNQSHKIKSEIDKLL